MCRAQQLSDLRLRFIEKRLWFMAHGRQVPCTPSSHSSGDSRIQCSALWAYTESSGSVCIYIYIVYIYSIYAFVCNAKTDVSVFWGARLRSLCMSLSWIQRNCTAFGCRMHSTAGSHHYRELAASYAQRQRDRRQTTQNAAVQCLQLNPKSKNASPRCTSPTR